MKWFSIFSQPFGIGFIASKTPPCTHFCIHPHRNDPYATARCGRARGSDPRTTATPVSREPDRPAFSDNVHQAFAEMNSTSCKPLATCARIRCYRSIARPSRLPDLLTFPISISGCHTVPLGWPISFSETTDCLRHRILRIDQIGRMRRFLFLPFCRSIRGRCFRKSPTVSRPRYHGTTTE